MFPEKQIRLILHLFGIQSPKEQNKCCLRGIKRSLCPSLVIMQGLVYWRWYYKYSKTFEQGCLINFFVCLILDFMIVWSHIKASNIDPGFVAKTYSTQLDVSERLFKKCGAGKTELVHHCSSCDRCVFLMDHHCWWTNNCVGYNSFKSFYLFSIYVMLLTIVGIITMIKNIYSTN